MIGICRISKDLETAWSASATESAILDAVRGLRYGTVEVVVHDARVVQIERRERIRVEGERTGKGGTHS